LVPTAFQIMEKLERLPRSRNYIEDVVLSASNRQPYGWRAFLRPFSPPDFVASYLNVLVFVVLVAAYHVKDEREWNPLRWTRRVTMDTQNPMTTREKDLELRKGRLHRANKEVFFCKENGMRILEFIWVWLK